MCTVVLSGSAVANLPTGSGEKPSRNPRAIFLTLTLSRSYSKNRVVFSFFLGIAKSTLSFIFAAKSTVLYFNAFLIDTSTVLFFNESTKILCVLLS